MIESCTDRTSLLSEEKHVLVLNDTTEINLQNNFGRLEVGSGIGLVGNNKDIGFFAHLGLAVDSQTGQALGFSRMQLWHRSLDKGTKESRGYAASIKENKINYGYATKDDVESLSKLVHSLSKEIEKLRQELPKPASRGKKIKSK